MSEGWEIFIEDFGRLSCNSSCDRLVKRWIFGAVIYFIWQERNFRFFQDKERTVNGLCTAIKECVKLKIIGAKFKKGLTFDHILLFYISVGYCVLLLCSVFEEGVQDDVDGVQVLSLDVLWILFVSDYGLLQQYSVHKEFQEEEYGFTVL
ncbi:hypothetical protein L6452_43405 [Arctium lappa]|uniref:Uncharacterized protein n=1 Tax=Arctium lappa TaxID=4217 RepID=A0ACB8XDM3_ARCLA|nr:hypothetical protein L6452_43405 [Arctium lappa]